MNTQAKVIRRYLKEIESKAALIEIFRAHALSEGGRLTQFGRDVVVAGKNSNVKQSVLVELLGISASAISKRYGE